MVYVLLLCHIFFCFKTRFIQRQTLVGIRYSFKGEGRTYSAFAAALGTTIGPGNIIGVAVAVSQGGAGSIFWMWLCGILSMATKYAESFLCLKYKKDFGGPMILLKSQGYNFLASLWSYLCVFAGLFMGAAVPTGALSEALPLPSWITGVVVAAFTIITVSFGVKGISKVCSYLVPVMSAGFIILCLVAIALDIKSLPSVIIKILRGAFSVNSVVGGGIGAAIKSGVTRGLYSNESGLGSGGILAAEADDKNTQLSSLGAMTTAFWDTVVMCALCGVVFVMGGADFGCDPAYAVIVSFSKIPFSRYFLYLSLTMFVFATVIGWYYIALRAVQFLNITPALFDIWYVCAVFFGSVTALPLWQIADTLNFLMLIPSMFIFIKLSCKISLHIK